MQRDGHKVLTILKIACSINRSIKWLFRFDRTQPGISSGYSFFLIWWSLSRPETRQAVQAV